MVRKVNQAAITDNKRLDDVPEYIKNRQQITGHKRSKRAPRRQAQRQISEEFKAENLALHSNN